MIRRTLTFEQGPRSGHQKKPIRMCRGKKKKDVKTTKGNHGVSSEISLKASDYGKRACRVELDKGRKESKTLGKTFAKH